MGGNEAEPESGLDAGAFSTWLDDTRRVQQQEGTADVPCGSCTACCTSSYFVHIGPEETETLASIPAELLFPAPGRPTGHMVLGYDEHGHCPMLAGGKCSIYAHRPKTCRAYDCRVFPATGLAVLGEDKQQIAERAGRWRFSPPDADDLRRRTAVQAAARFMVEHAERFPDGFLPRNPTQLAVLAVEVYDVFLARGEQETSDSADAELVVRAVVEASREFDDKKPARAG